jgi:hypothetical protein
MSGLITTTTNAATLPSSSSGATELGRSSSSNLHGNSQECPVHSPGLARLKKLYPFVDLNELPLAWSAKDKANFISLSENNLKVHYKGNGKGHKDAASVRATHPIPESCLLYYYEIRIVSKGRDGYMGIGLAAQNVNMQRLPGWDKQSYGYHGDDGHSFSSSGTGQPYGPTFTTNDVIGCAYNLVENKCFYTKNGFSLGVAFSDLPNVPLYPTVGLQTPGEEVEANFGLEPFVYDIEQDLEALRTRITSSISQYPVQYSKWQDTMQHLVQTWLVHNGYCSTAELFAAATRKPLTLDATHARQRLRIQQLVLAGKIGEAIALTERQYPDVLSAYPDLLFALKCRQFVELIAGNDTWPNVSVGSAATASTTTATATATATSNESTESSSSSSFAMAAEHSNGECNGNAAASAESARMEVDEQTEPSPSSLPPVTSTDAIEPLYLSSSSSSSSLSLTSSLSGATDKHRLEHVLAFGESCTPSRSNSNISGWMRTTSDSCAMRSACWHTITRPIHRSAGN